MTPTKPPKPIQEQRADIVYKMVAAVGFLLDSFNQLDHLSAGKQTVFKMGLKNAAIKFQVQLEQAENQITNGGYETNATMMEQMADSYLVVDHLMSLQLEAGRILTSESIELFTDVTQP